jgi:hypothetical protein
MLHRVVMKRSGRRAVAEDASGFTAADHLICTIVRQARNFPARCWNTCTLRVDQPPPKAAPSPEATDRFLRRLSQIRMPRSNCYRQSRTRFPCATNFQTLPREAFGFPARFYSDYFLYLRYVPADSVIAVSGANRSLVVFREGISQGASLAW